ncbi:MAG: glycoside hydrolase family 3 C-terminal domain-containing protein [Chloroflexi bacterium]|nr:glycoside hydrolase family 3 C-terminal domain-containing protein [Chloroflexota bacterium]
MTESNPNYQNPAYSIAERVQDLLARMTLAEKIAQLGSCEVKNLQDERQGFSASKAAALMAQGIGQITRVGGGSTLAPQDIARMCNAIQAYLVHHTRLGIPAIVHDECCSGFMAHGATCFPQIAGLASTWMPELAEKMTTIIRTQMRAVGTHQGLAPVLDVARDPRWGRVEETFGEDPLFVSRMGMAYVRGLQGPDLREGVMATGKHFLGHGISEAGMNCTPVHVGLRELRDVFLMPFQAVVQEAKLASMMNAYSELDGAVVASSHAIMTDLLRDEIGFDGVVVSDYRAIPMLYDYHHVAPDQAHAAALALNAGIDVELPSIDCYGPPLVQSLQAGLIPESIVDTAVERVLRKKFELGLFEKPFVDVERVLSVFDQPEQRQLARQIAEQSIVLLKNDNDVLPLSKTLNSIAVIGPNAHQTRALFGDYAYPAHVGDPPDSQVGRSRHAQTILDAIRAQVSPQTNVLYAEGCKVNDADRSGFEQAIQVAQAAEVVVLVVGDRSGLQIDCTCGESRDSADLALPGVQPELVEKIAAVGKPTVLVLVNGRPFAIPEIVESIPAIVEAWLPGEEGASAVASVLFGDVNPGGKLTMTWPRSVGQVPIFYNHKPSGGRSNWHTNYVSLSVQPLFPFGHGLSYTQFEYSNLKIETTDARVTVHAKIKNVGARAGDEVVQLYVRDEVASVPRPVKELKGFRRVHLTAGESCAVTFDLPIALFAFYDEAIQLVVEPGTMQVMIGSSSEDIRLNGSFEITGPKQIISRRVFA